TTSSRPCSHDGEPGGRPRRRKRYETTPWCRGPRGRPGRLRLVLVPFVFGYVGRQHFDDDVAGGGHEHTGVHGRADRVQPHGAPGRVVHQIGRYARVPAGSSCAPVVRRPHRTAG